MSLNVFDAKGRLRKTSHGVEHSRAHALGLRVLYAVTLLATFVPLHGSGWVAIAMGGPWLSIFGVGYVVVVPLVVYRAVSVLRWPGALDAPAGARLGQAMGRLGALLMQGVASAERHDECEARSARCRTHAPSVDGGIRGAPSTMLLRAMYRAWWLLLATACALQLSACAKTVQWEEEVPLNTGETIWVKRTVNYSVKSGAGNPFDMAYRPDRVEVVEFKWSGKAYRYEGDAVLLVLAISPRKQPVLVAGADDSSWYARHNYKCVTPFYVELIPDATGNIWSWPPQIETWLYNLPPNLMLQRKRPEEMKGRYTAEQRRSEDYAGSLHSDSHREINPTYTADHCNTRR